MNKNVLTAIIVVVVLGLLGGYLFLKGGNTVSKSGVNGNTVGGNKVTGPVQPYKPVEKLETVNIDKNPEAKLATKSGSGGKITTEMTLIYGGKEYTGEVVEYVGLLKKKDDKVTLTVNEKVLDTSAQPVTAPTTLTSGSGTNSGAVRTEPTALPTYKDVETVMELKLADQIFLSDIKQMYNLKKEDLEDGKRYTVSGIKIVNPSNQETVNLFYKFIPQELEAKNTDLLIRYNKEIDEIVSKGGADMPEKLKAVNEKYGFIEGKK